MNKNDFVRYKNLLLAKQQELSSRTSPVGTIPTLAETRGDLVDAATSEVGVPMQIQLNKTNSKLLQAVDDALKRMRQGKFGSCEECGQPISKARLEAVPWARLCGHCKDHEDSRS